MTDDQTPDTRPIPKIRFPLAMGPTNPFQVPLNTPASGSLSVIEEDTSRIDDEEFPGRPRVIIEPFSSPELAILHKRACVMCLERDGQDETKPLTAEEVVEAIAKRAAPVLARPTPKKLLSGTGALRPKAATEAPVAKEELPLSEKPKGSPPYPCSRRVTHDPHDLHEWEAEGQRYFCVGYPAKHAKSGN